MHVCPSAIATAGFRRIHFHTCDVGKWIERQSAGVHPASTARPNQTEAVLVTGFARSIYTSAEDMATQDYYFGSSCADTETLRKGTGRKLGLAALVRGFFSNNGRYIDGTFRTLGETEKRKKEKIVEEETKKKEKKRKLEEKAQVKR